ncbi:hypothetical protein N9K49_00230 [Flavobacteriaceae bacterium]|nr:hypothetical protein [Flavobacteriaceae bacterium]
MKKQTSYFLATILSLLLFNSCDPNDTSEISEVPFSPVSITLTSSDNNVTVDESAISGSEIFTITATIDKPQEVDFAIILEQIGGTATNGVDYSFDESILISAGETSATGEISILKSGDIEVDETLAVGFKTADVNADLSNFSFLATITNDYINNVLDLTLAWDGTSTSGDVTINSFCEMDFDLILYDSNFNYVDYVLGSADCPEEGSISGLADGTYYLVADLYSNPYEGSSFTDNIPLRLSWSQDYFPETSGIIINNANAINRLDSLDASGGYTQEGLGALVVQLDVVGGYNYTLTAL